MLSIKDIPARCAGRSPPRLPIPNLWSYDMLVREIIGDKIDKIWNVIMAEGGKSAIAMAESLG